MRHLPDLGIEAGEVDPLVEPAPDPVVAGVGNKMRDAADVFVIPGFQPIAPDHLHRALLAAVGDEPKKQPRRMVVAFARALVERAIDLQRDVPAPSEHRIGDEIDIDIAKQHRRAVPGFAPRARHPVPTTIFAVRRFHAKIPARSHRTPYPKSASTIKSLVRIMEV